MTPALEQAQCMRQLAETYRAWGFNLVPLGADKRPVVTGVNPGGGVYRFRWEDWQTQPQTAKLWQGIRKPEWWTEVAGIAAVCGPVSGDLVCIDFDKTEFGSVDTFLSLLNLSFLWVVDTPGGGWHVWLRCPGLTLDKGKLDQPAATGNGHIELRHAGHYAALPGSAHPSGGTYAWHSAPPVEPPPIVDQTALLDAYHVVTVATPKVQTQPPVAPVNGNGYHQPEEGANKWAQAALASEVDELKRAAVGGRNAALNKAAFALGSIVAGGYLTEHAVIDALTAAAQAIGLADDEISATLDSGLQSGAKSPRHPSEHSASAVETYEYGFVVETPDFDDLDLPEANVKRDAWPYCIKNGQMQFLRENKDGDVISAPIADFAVTISEEVVDENGNAMLVLAGEGLRRGKFTAEISGLDFGSDAKLLAVLTGATGGIDPVYKDMHKHLRPAIGLLTETGRRPRRVRYFRTGWQDDHFHTFLLPNMDENTLISMPPQMAYSAPPANADLEFGLLALRNLIEAFDPAITTPVVSALLLPPLLRPAGWGNERVAVFIAGRTGSLKTSWTQTAMCLYGHEFSNNDKLLKFGDGATRTAIMSFAAHAHDLPLFIDNYKPNTGNGKNDFINLIHNILEGGDRKRADRAGNLRDNRLIRCIPIATGEDVPRDDAASLARILLVSFAWQRGEANDKLTAAQIASLHLNAVGSAWLQWLAADGRNQLQSTAAMFPAYRAKWADVLRKLDPDSANIARVASNLAINELTWEIALQCPQLGEALQPYTNLHQRGLRTIARTMAKSTTEAMEALQWRNALNELLASGQYVIIDRAAEKVMTFERDRRLGWKDSNGIYLLPSITMAAVKKLLGPGSLPISTTALYDQMAGMGWLARRGTSHTTCTISVGDDRPHVLHLRPEALTAKPSEEDDADSNLEELGL